MRAYRRVIKRRRYRCSCQCAAAPRLITVPAPPRLIPKGILGISVWVTVLIDKYLLYRPTYRLLADLRAHGLDLAQGTVTDGMSGVSAPLFAPLREALIERSRTGQHWHADETRWQVFEANERGRLPALVSVGVLECRGGRVHADPFGAGAEAAFRDRDGGQWSALIASSRLASLRDTELVLSFCWVHMRRDFITVAPRTGRSGGVGRAVLASRRCIT